LTSALLGTCLSVALVPAALAGNSKGHGSSGQSPAKVLQSADAIDMASGAAVAGAGVLVRSRSELDMRLATSGLDLNAAYTVWWLIFNRPWNCSNNECGPDDLVLPSGVPNEASIAATGAVVFNATGFVTGSDGTANASAHVEDGPLPVGTGTIAPLAGYLWPGNGLRAEVQLIIRTHGAAIPGEVALQTSTIGETCGSVCMDQQVIVFKAPQRRN
jgi:hypothetical protein